MNNYAYGRRKELKVARSLRGKGASVEISPGSKGAAGLKAHFPNGKKLHIQVKATRGLTPAVPSRKDVGRLKQSASRSGATPCIAKVSSKGITYESARTRKEIKTIE
jgi:Holliday junction resolvase